MSDCDAASGEDAGGKVRARRTSRKAALKKASFNDDEEWDFEKDDETTVIYEATKDGGDQSDDDRTDPGFALPFKLIVRTGRLRWVGEWKRPGDPEPKPKAARGGTKRKRHG